MPGTTLQVWLQIRVSWSLIRTLTPAPHTTGESGGTALLCQCLNDLGQACPLSGPQFPLLYNEEISQQ